MENMAFSSSKKVCVWYIIRLEHGWLNVLVAISVFNTAGEAICSHYFFSFQSTKCSRVLAIHLHQSSCIYTEPFLFCRHYCVATLWVPLDVGYQSIVRSQKNNIANVFGIRGIFASYQWVRNVNHLWFCFENLDGCFIMSPVCCTFWFIYLLFFIFFSLFAIVMIGVDTNQWALTNSYHLLKFVLIFFFFFYTVTQLIPCGVQSQEEAEWDHDWRGGSGE